MSIEFYKILYKKFINDKDNKIINYNTDYKLYSQELHNTIINIISQHLFSEYHIETHDNYICYGFTYNNMLIHICLCFPNNYLSFKYNLYSNDDINYIINVFNKILKN